MEKTRRIKKRKSVIASVMTKHILNHKKQYLIAVVLFTIGLMVGIMFINHASDTQFEEISQYITSVTNTMKASDNIDYGASLKSSIASNIVLVLVMWFAASTIIGIPIVYGTLIIRGFALGYTVSGILASLGTGAGIAFSLSCLLLHNILFIPAMLALSVSGMDLYQSIVKKRGKESIKIVFIRHTIFCIVMLGIMLISSLVETYISFHLGKWVVSTIKI